MMDPTDFVPVITMAIPIVAIVGGITVAVVKTLGRQRMAELVYRERIAAIERGLDPAQLPPGPAVDTSLPAAPGTYASARQRSQGLLIGGLVTTFAGLGIMAFFSALAPEEGKNTWAIGIVPVAVGLALLLSAWLVWPRGADRNGGGAVSPRS